MELQGSPEMKAARHRLGNLLQGIRENSAAGDLEDADEDFGRQTTTDYLSPKKAQPGKPKPRTRKERKVLFELRGKPFELRDNQREEALFSLCRTWVQGREFYPSTTGIDDDISAAPAVVSGEEEETVEAMAAREVHELPRPNGPPLQRQPLGSITQPSAPESAAVDTSSAASLLASYVPHWKAVKRQWQRDGKRLQEPQRRSLGVLRAMHALQAQSSILNS